jgi:hypothetical protein
MMILDKLLPGNSNKIELKIPQENKKSRLLPGLLFPNEEDLDPINLNSTAEVLEIMANENSLVSEYKTVKNIRGYCQRVGSYMRVKQVLPPKFTDSICPLSRELLTEENNVSLKSLSDSLMSEWHANRLTSNAISKWKTNKNQVPLSQKPPISSLLKLMPNRRQWACFGVLVMSVLYGWGSHKINTNSSNIKKKEKIDSNTLKLIDTFRLLLQVELMGMLHQSIESKLNATIQNITNRLNDFKSRLNLDCQFLTVGQNINCKHGKTLKIEAPIDPTNAGHCLVNGILSSSTIFHGRVLIKQVDGKRLCDSVRYDEKKVKNLMEYGIYVGPKLWLGLKVKDQKKALNKNRIEEWVEFKIVEGGKSSNFHKESASNFKRVIHEIKKLKSLDRIYEWL